MQINSLTHSCQRQYFSACDYTNHGIHNNQPFQFRTKQGLLSLRSSASNTTHVVLTRANILAVTYKNGQSHTLPHIYMYVPEKKVT